MSDNVERPAPKFKVGQVVASIQEHSHSMKVWSIEWNGPIFEWCYSCCEGGFWRESWLRSLTPEEIGGDLVGKLAACEEGKSVAYSERDRLVCAVSKMFPAHLERHPDSDATWEDDWRWIVFVQFPTGQASWHIHDSEVSWFDHLERRDGNSWDGHSTAEKYARIERFENIGNLSSLQQMVAQADARTETALREGVLISERHRKACEMGVKLYRPDLNKDLLKIANRPIVQSLLYDLDLLPEQLSSQKNLTLGLFAAYLRLEGVLVAFASMDHIKQTDLMEARALCVKLLEALKECSEVACSETCDHLYSITTHTPECRVALAVIAEAEAAFVGGE